MSGKCKACNKDFKNVALHFNKMHSNYSLTIINDRINEAPAVWLQWDTYTAHEKREADFFGGSKNESWYTITLGSKSAVIRLDNDYNLLGIEYCVWEGAIGLKPQEKVIRNSKVCIFRE